MSATRALCGVCGQRWPWLFTAYWFEDSGRRLAVVVDPAGAHPLYPDDRAELRVLPASRLTFLPVCSTRCGGVNTGWVGGFVVARTAYEEARRAEMRAVLPEWYPADGLAAEGRRAA